MNNTAAVILAAGEGTRIKARSRNKCVFKLAGRPMIQYPVETLLKLGISEIIVIVKFLEKSVRKALTDYQVTFVKQGEKKGTAAALEFGIKSLSSDIKNVIVICGDDSAFYTKNLFTFLLNQHQKYQSIVTLLSIKLDNPTGLGRIIRNKSGQITGIVEEKVATPEQGKITEINTGCYCFSLDFLKHYLPQIKENPISHEYYLTDIVEIAFCHNQKVQACLYPNTSIWFGINDKSQWIKARIIKRKK